MCRHIYDWNIVNCDVKQPIQQQQQQLSYLGQKKKNVCLLSHAKKN